jgi:simple sugar transport system ATP-binding protein
VLEFDLAENLCLREYRTPAFSQRGFLWPKKMVARARTLLKEFDVRGGEPATRAGSLSGGNQQKVVIARELNGDPQVIIAAQPTRGLDVGAIEFVHRRLVEERDKGRAILLVSLELDEIRSLSDRALVIYEGEIVAELDPSASEEDFGVAMTGGGRKREVAA